MSARPAPNRLPGSGRDAGHAAGQCQHATRRFNCDPENHEIVTRLVLAAGSTRTAAIEGISAAGADPAVVLDRAADALDLQVTVTDSGFSDAHPAMAACERDETEKGVGMGGALALADRAALPVAEVRDGVRDVYDRLLDEADREVRRQ